ncbi:cupin [Nocardiopsis sp. CNR-923]|uniref:JmjC domain-containing protein n=1 Tax=Nocardiopsis sp. CNR-923 TaxID=1904965 RepID=UPI00095F6E57|nr:cupin domain-containing protein [Nocardiopsis sp. CNR-923]OLT30726.1 cupin [Nocardiopsis sp. CNR-923]
MEHRLVSGIEKALGWDGPGSVGTAFARGTLADPSLLTRLMTPYRLLETIQRRHLANPQLRCYADGNELHPSSYLSTVVNRRRQAVSQADMAALGVILNNGGTIVLDSVDTFDPTMEVACRALGWWSGELVSVNCYLAVGDTDGFHLHWDDHDVIAVQLSGEKSWEVRGPSRPVPMYRDAEQNVEPSEDVVWSGTMVAGDVMHIPRGWWHTATRIGSGNEGHSLHVTFGITKRTGVTWANFLSDAARADADFRADLENTHGPINDEYLVSKLADLVRANPPSSYLDQLRVSAPPQRHMPLVSSFGALDEMAVVAVTEFPPNITVSKEAVQVAAGGKKLIFHARAEEGLRLLLSGHPVSLHGGGADLKALAAHLTKEGLCAPLTEGLSWGYTDLVPSLNSFGGLSTSG